MTVDVLRGGRSVGRAVGTLGAGDPSLEINHPGGLCWGAGAAAQFQVTPDNRPGDVSGQPSAPSSTETVTQNASAQQVVDNPATATPWDVIFRGSAANLAGTARFPVARPEQRLITPRTTRSSPAGTTDSSG